MEPRQHYNVTLAILTLAGSAFSLQQTMVFPALSTFQREFDTSTAWATWILTGFLVSAAVTTPILGRLGDQFGKKRVLIVSLSLFTLGCLGAAAAWSIWSLIAFRVRLRRRRRTVPVELRDHPRRVPGGQGEGRDRAAVRRLGRRRRLRDRPLRRDRRPRVVALALRARLDPGRDHDRADPPAHPRVAGALTVARGLSRRAAAGGSAAVADGRAHRGRELGLDVSAPVLGLAALSAACFVLWGLVELRSESPMVDMRMLAHRPVLLTNVATMISGFALFSCFLLVPSFVQTPRTRLRLRCERDDGRPVPPAELGRDAVFGSGRRPHRTPCRVEMAARRQGCSQSPSRRCCSP